MINEYYVTKYCCEDLSLIENYELAVNDHTQMWEIHHRGEILPCGRFSRADLKKFGLYFNRPASELIFLTKAEHNSLHKRGITLSEEHKRAISDALKGIPLSEAHKKAIGEAQKGIPKPQLKGIPLSEAHKKAIGEAQRGIPKSEATKKAISDGLKGHPVSEECRAKLSKKVLQFTKSGEFICEWPSATEASRQLGISQGNICSCCNGKRKYAGGYIWQYSTL